MDKKRGNVAPNKKAVNWRLRIDLLALADAEAKAKHFKSLPSFIEFILLCRYYPNGVHYRKLIKRV